MKSHRIVAKPWFTAVGLCLLLGAVVLAAILNLPASAEPPEPWADNSIPIEEPAQSHLENPVMTPEKPIKVSLRAQGWTNIMTEDFEGAWPAPGWTVFDNDGLTNGEYYWGPTMCFDFGASGDNDAVPHSDGASAMYTCWSPYPTNLKSWMVYGPFDLSTATSAGLLFDLNLHSERGHDYFKWMASINGTNFFGYQQSGDSGGWVTKNFDLTNVPTLGNLTGQPQVWIAFVFYSDSNVTDTYAGPWLDNIILRASIGPAPTTYITTEDNENNAHTHTPDGDMYPANPDCIYNNNYKPTCPDLRNPLAPIEFNIFVPSLPSFTTAELSLYAWDVDEEGDPANQSRPVQRDEVYLNGHLVGTLTGADGSWSTSHFYIDPSWVQQGNNLVEVKIDVYNRCWCVRIDWGQLVLGGGGGTAFIYSWGPSRDCWWPGSTQAMFVEVDTSLSSQEVRVEVNVLDAQDVNLIGASQTKIIYGNQDDAFIFNLDVPWYAQTGHYKLQVIVYDTLTGHQNDYDELTILIDPTCGTVTPTPTSTPTSGPTPTPTPTPTTTPSVTPIWKEGGWIDYAPSGMPDFDQRQDLWDNPKGSGVWSYCGPLAVANCLWWFDSKMEPYPVSPPTINDNYPLVTAYGAWDDHDPSNLIPFVDDLAWRMDTDGQRTGGTWAGTYVTDMYDAIGGYLADRGLADKYALVMVEKPTFDWVAAEVEKCEDVMLLLGFWTWDYEKGWWNRLGGHFVTTVGVDWVNRQIAFSNPIKDSAESGWPGRVLNGTLISHVPISGHAFSVHNDAGNISHDIYYAVSTDSPGGIWGPADYATSYQQIKSFFNQNFPRDFPQEFRAKKELRAYAGADIQTEVEYAIAISPIESPPFPFHIFLPLILKNYP